MKNSNLHADLTLAEAQLVAQEEQMTNGLYAITSYGKGGVACTKLGMAASGVESRLKDHACGFANFYECSLLELPSKLTKKQVQWLEEMMFKDMKKDGVKFDVHVSGIEKEVAFLSHEKAIEWLKQAQIILNRLN